jgi:toxin-antitoxin system PIN domain toxin
MVNLLDVNLLIALAWPSHIHHEQAHKWFDENASSGWATCPLTQCGFIRVSSNKNIIPYAVSPQEAISALRDIVAMENHAFWPDSISWFSNRSLPHELIVGHHQVTDAYLLGLAIKNKGRLATLDRRISALLKPRSPYQNSLNIIH